MWELLTGKTMQRLVVFCTISYLLSTANITWDDSRFWCFIVLLFVLEHLAHMEGMQHGTENLLNMPRAKLLKLKDFMDKVERGGDHSEEELNTILKKEDKNADE